MSNAIYYFNGQDGTIFFDQYSDNITYIHENDGDFTTEYMEQVLSVLNIELVQKNKFQDLNKTVQDELCSMEYLEPKDYV